MERLTCAEHNLISVFEEEPSSMLYLIKFLKIYGVATLDISARHCVVIKYMGLDHSLFKCDSCMFLGNGIVINHD